jgi:hypothetical protein
MCDGGDDNGADADAGADGGGRDAASGGDSDGGTLAVRLIRDGRRESWLLRGELR